MVPTAVLVTARTKGHKKLHHDNFAYAAEKKEKSKGELKRKNLTVTTTMSPATALPPGHPTKDGATIRPLLTTYEVPGTEKLLLPPTIPVSFPAGVPVVAHLKPSHCKGTNYLV